MFKLASLRHMQAAWIWDYPIPLALRFESENKIYSHSIETPVFLSISQRSYLPNQRSWQKKSLQQEWLSHALYIDITAQLQWIH